MFINYKKFKRQQGFSFISILVLPIFIIIADFVFSALLAAQIHTKIDKQISADLLKIKTAIIAYATTFNNKPGRIVCPGIKEEGTELLSGSNCKFLTQTISWKTLDLGYKFQNTALGTEYFYQVSPQFSAGANSKNYLINQNSVGNLQMINKDGNLITNIVAIIAVPKTYINYNSDEITNGNFIVDLRDTNLWKSAIYITDKEILYNTQKRITNEIFACLYNHKKSTKLPNPAPLLNQIQSNYNSNSNSFFGRLPKTEANVGISQNLNKFNQQFNDFLPNLQIKNNTENISDFGLDNIKVLKIKLTNLRDNLYNFNVYQHQIYNVLVELNNKAAEVNKSLQTLNNSYLSYAITNNKITKSQQQKVIEYTEKINNSFQELQTLFNNYNVDFFLPLLKYKAIQLQNNNNNTYTEFVEFLSQTDFNNNSIIENAVNNFDFLNNNDIYTINNLISFIAEKNTTTNIYSNSINSIYNLWLVNANYFSQNTTLSGTIDATKNTTNISFFDNIKEFQANNNTLNSWLNDLQIIANQLAIQAQKDISLSSKNAAKNDDTSSLTTLSSNLFDNAESLIKKIDSYLNRQNKTNRDKLNIGTQNFFIEYKNFLNAVNNQQSNLFGYYAQQWEIFWQSPQCAFLLPEKYNNLLQTTTYFTQQQWDDIFFYQLQKDANTPFEINNKKLNTNQNFVLITSNIALKNQQRSYNKIQITNDYFELCNADIYRDNLAENPSIKFCNLSSKYNANINKNFNDILRY